jgi:hypothetical protein
MSLVKGGFIERITWALCRQTLTILEAPLSRCVQFTPKPLPISWACAVCRSRKNCISWYDSLIVGVRLILVPALNPDLRINRTVSQFRRQ